MFVQNKFETLIGYTCIMDIHVQYNVVLYVLLYVIYINFNFLTSSVITDMSLAPITTTLTLSLSSSSSVIRRGDGESEGGGGGDIRRLLVLEATTLLLCQRKTHHHTHTLTYKNKIALRMFSALY